MARVPSALLHQGDLVRHVIQRAAPDGENPERESPASIAQARPHAMIDTVCARGPWHYLRRGREKRLVLLTPA